MHHRYTVASGDVRVRRCGIYRPRASCSHERDTAQISIDLPCGRVDDICAVALLVRRAVGDAYAKMVLGDDLHSKVILQHIDERIAAYCFHQSALYLGAGVIGVVQDAKLRVTALAVKVVLPLGVLVEVHSPLHKLHNLLRCVSHHLLHSSGIADPVAGDHRVVDVFVKIINQQVCHRGYTALCLGGVCFVKSSLAAQCNLVLLRTCYLQSETHTGYAAADDQKVVFMCHKPKKR